MSHSILHNTSLPLWQMAIPATPHVGPPRTIGILRGSAQPATTVEQPDRVGDDISNKAPVGTTDILSFDGQNADGVAPPDTEGVVGATQYVQWVNIEYNVYDKTTGSKILGPIQGNSFWNGLGGACSSNNDGDPIIQYDKANNVWVAAQNVFVTPYMVCIAVSTTSDATGTYNQYAFNLGSVNFPDYPKWGLWSDGYYQSFNNFKNAISALNAEACAYDGAAMRAGAATATQVCFTTASSSQFSILPSDLDGLTPPPAGAPNHYVDLASTTNGINKWDFHVDFVTPTNSTFTGPTKISTSSFSEICSGGANRSCIPEPSPGEKLDSLGDRLMYRNSYRNLGTYESLLETHTVKPGGTSRATANVRWYELRSTPPGGAFTQFQAGTIASGATSLWLASIAQDKLGDIAIGFSESSSSLKPSVYYTGRVPTDAAGTMEGAKQVVAGTGVQESTSHRWGDYSMMSIDPADDCTFWFTEEYIKTTGSFNWSTRINSFKFNNCN